MTNEEILGVAEILERATNWFNEQAARFREWSAAYDRLIAEMSADHEAKMAELGARTSADAKIIEGLRAAADEQVLSASKVAYVLRCAGETPVQAAQRVVKERDGLLTQVQDQRAEIERLRNDERKAYQDGEALRAEVADLRGIVDMVHASLGIKRGDHIGNAIAQLKAQTPKRSHPVAVGEYLRRLTGFSTTPAGEVAQVLHVDCDAPTTEYTVKRPNGQQGVWSESGCEPCDPPAEATHDTPEGRSVAESVIRDGRKTEPKPGDTVRLVRIPSRDVVSLELQTVLEWPWIERWGTLNQIAMVVEPRYQLDGAVAVCLSTNVHARWPINCLEVVAAATHDTEAGNAAAGAALKTEPVAEEIKVGDMVEVFQKTGSCTFETDIGTRGTVLQMDDSCVDTAPLDGYLSPKGNHVALCDVRKVTQ